MNRIAWVVVVLLALAGGIVAWQAWATIAPKRAFDDLTVYFDGTRAPKPAEIAPHFEALHRAGPEELRTLIRSNLDSGDDRRRATALHLVGSWRVIIDDWGTVATAPAAPRPETEAADEFLPDIEAALSEPDPLLRIAGVEAYSALLQPSAALTDRVRSIAQDDSDESAREHATQVLAAKSGR
ncbi:MAG: hypothetical protein AAF488_08720 [Planctomycetota bacterium]